jgi:hypothetical protein
MALSFENISTIINYENTSIVLNFDVYDYGAEWPIFYALLDFLGISYSLNDVFQSDET